VEGHDYPFGPDEELLTISCDLSEGVCLLALGFTLESCHIPEHRLFGEVEDSPIGIEIRAVGSNTELINIPLRRRQVVFTEAKIAKP
jgi:hypothetical protein